jgi:O-antigen/teichoic acid export membrane protein
MMLNKTLIGYFYVFFGSSFARVIALFNNIIIARMLGPIHFGVFSIFYIVMILTWQLPQAFDSVFVTYAKKVDSMREKNDILKTSVILKLFYLVIILFISYPLTYALANYCFQKNEIRGLLMAAMLCGGFLTFLMTIASTFQEEERFLRFASLHAFYTILIFICLVALKLIRIEFTLKSVIGIYIAVSIIIGAISIVLLCRRVGNLFILDKAILQRSFNQGKWIFGVVLFFFLFTRIDMLFLTRYLDFESLGIYSVAAQFVSVVALAAGALAGVSLPKASIAVRSRESFRIFVRESFWAIVLIEAAIGVLILFAPFVVTILYGNEYTLSGNILRILLYGWIFGVVFIPFSFLFYSLGDFRTRFYLELLKLITGVLLLYWLVPKFGFIGGAYAITLTLFISTILSLVVLRYRLTQTYRELSLC